MSAAESQQQHDDVMYSSVAEYIRENAVELRNERRLRIVRRRRRGAGLCVDCAEESSTYRCVDCVVKHFAARRRCATPKLGE